MVWQVHVKRYHNWIRLQLLNMNVKVFKLINGEEIIANVMSIGTDRITVQNPCVLQMVQHPETKQPIQAFADWPALARHEQDVQIPITALTAFPLDAHEELERNYVSNITGLELPPVTPKILLG